MVVWEWQAWRCFDHIEETFEEKGWKTGVFGRERHDNEVMPLLAESNGHCLAFFERDPATNECWFELRDKARHRVVYVRGANNIPVPKDAAGLLEDYGWPLDEAGATRSLPLYSLPVAPMVGAR
jgi:hypothetical protein